MKFRIWVGAWNVSVRFWVGVGVRSRVGSRVRAVTVRVRTTIRIRNRALALRANLITGYEFDSLLAAIARYRGDSNLLHFNTVSLSLTLIHVSLCLT